MPKGKACWPHTVPPMYVETNRSSAFSCGTGAYNTFIFNAVIQDNQGVYNNGTGVFTPGVEGEFLLSYHIGLVNTAWVAGDVLLVDARRNNSGAANDNWYGMRTQIQANHNAELHCQGNVALHMSATDNLRVVYYLAHGAGAVNSMTGSGCWAIFVRVN